MVKDEFTRLSRAYPALANAIKKVDVKIVPLDPVDEVADYAPAQPRSVSYAPNILSRYPRPVSVSARRATIVSRALNSIPDELTLGSWWSVSGYGIGTYRHELGHHVYDTVMTTVQREKLRQIWSPLSRREINEQISGQAAKNIYEFFAEAFAGIHAP